MENPLFTWNMIQEFNRIYQKNRKEIDNSVICGIRCEIKRSKSGEGRKLSRKECFDEAMTTLCGVYNFSVDELLQQKREVGQIEKVSPKLTEYQTAVFEVYGAVGFSDNDLMQSAWGIVLERYREQTKPTSIGEGFADLNRQLAEFKSNWEKTQDELRKDRATFFEKIECVSKNVVEAREENKEQHRTTRERVNNVAKKVHVPIYNPKSKKAVGLARKLWEQWPNDRWGTDYATGKPRKQDCYEHHKKSLNEVGISSVDEYIRTLDTGRKL